MKFDEPYQKIKTLSVEYQMSKFIFHHVINMEDKSRETWIEFKGKSLMGFSDFLEEKEVKNILFAFRQGLRKIPYLDECGRERFKEGWREFKLFQ